MDIYILETRDLSFAEVEKYMPMVTESRRRRVERKRSDAAKVESLMAEVLVLWGIKKRTGLTARDISFEHGAHGKPYIKGSTLQFSLSHTKGAVCAAFSEDEEIGADIERKDRQVSENVKSRVLSGQERLKCLSQEDFIRAWVMKEAFLKRLGIGITRDLRNVDTLGLPDTAALECGEYLVGISGKGAANAEIITVEAAGICQ